jgi:hypothetical protein
MNTSAQTDAPPESLAPGEYLSRCVVVVANRPVPLILARSFGPSAEYWAGMGAAILAALVLGYCAIALFRPLRGVLVYGGLCVALGQVLFVPHLFAGIAAAYIVSTFGRPTGDFARGFWLTLATGGVLTMAALFYGFFFSGPDTRRTTDGAGERN